jgi:hypothetical protein
MNRVLITLSGNWVHEVGTHVSEGDKAERLKHVIASGSLEKLDEEAG